MSTKTEYQRVSVDLPKDFHKRVKSFAALHGKSMRDLVVESLTVSMEASEIQCPHSHKPNKRLAKALKNAEEGKNLVEYKDAKDLFKKLRE